MMVGHQPGEFELTLCLVLFVAFLWPGGLFDRIALVPVRLECCMILFRRIIAIGFS